MEQQRPIVSQENISKSYCSSWKQFIDKAMQILVQNPIKSRYVLKYNNKKHTFILRVTDGARTVIKKSNPDTDYDQVQKFTKLAARALSNQSDKKAQQTQQQSKDPKKKKNKKKR